MAVEIDGYAVGDLDLRRRGWRLEGGKSEDVKGVVRSAECSEDYGGGGWRSMVRR